MTRFLAPALRQITAILSIALVLGGVVVSGHAMAAHVNGLSNAVAAPCHHGLENTNQTVGMAGALDLCRQLCLNKIPDTAISAAAVQPHEPSTAILTIGISCVDAAMSPKITSIVGESAPPIPPRRSSPATYQRLQI